jgi:uncharacterized membrane protein
VARRVITGYTVLKFLHVLLAVVAVGANATYGAWIARGARDPRSLPAILRGVKWLDDFVANPAYVLLLVSGLAMVFLYELPWQPWLVAGVALWLVAAALGFGVYTPTLRRQIAALEQGGAQSDEYRRLAARGGIVGGVLAFVVVAIVFVMVTKPGG